ncbi:MAG TPA: hypothetical protein VF545_11200 [Thermoleophilaceae bacterium]|jgi:hypothetical protein
MRTRTWPRLGGLLLIGACALAPAAPAWAAAPAPSPPSLTTTRLEGTLVITQATCDKNGTSTFSYTSAGTSQQNYVGVYTESGTFTISQQTDTSLGSNGVGVLSSFSADFTIDSQFPPGTVTGHKQLSPTAPTEPSLADGLAFCDFPDFLGRDRVFFITGPFENVDYVAQIQTDNLGNRTDSGGSNVAGSSLSDLPGGNGLAEEFLSTEPVAPPLPERPGCGLGDPHHVHVGPPHDDDLCPVQGH